MVLCQRCAIDKVNRGTKYIVRSTPSLLRLKSVQEFRCVSSDSQRGSEPSKPTNTTSTRTVGADAKREGEPDTGVKEPWWTVFVPKDSAVLDVKSTLKFSAALIFGMESFRWLTSESK